MQVISINVGELRTIPRRGHQVKTGIFKQPIEGAIAVQSHGLDGDAQGDLTLHGGTEKAIYVYPKEHYKYWGKKFPELNLSWGIFGENLTIDDFQKEDFIVAAGEEKSYWGNKVFRLTIGNKQGIDLILNGKSLVLPESEGKIVKDFIIDSKMIE